MRRIGVPVVLLIALLCCAGSAQAAQRFASPGGSGEACSSAAPCSLQIAVEKSGPGDEVIVGSGTYTLKSTLSPPFVEPEEARRYIHGDFAGPMPKIVASGLGAGAAAVAVLEDRLSYLEISLTGSDTSAVECVGAEIDRLIVVAKGANVGGIGAQPGCAIRDSLVRAEGTESGGVSVAGLAGNGTALLRNVTIRATGPGSVGVSASFPGGGLEEGSVTANLANVIVSGDQFDLRALEYPEGAGKIVASHSNFDSAKGEGKATITDAGGNQTAPPLFVDAAAGDFREAAGSPTIDAGTADQIGPTDLAGNARTLGAAPDIGAYEFVPPPTPGGSSGGSPQPTPPPPPPPAVIKALSISPLTFRAANFGGAIISRAGKPRAKAPVGATVAFTLSGAATVSFSVEKRATGRKVGNKCMAVTPANRAKAKCPLFKAVKGGFQRDGAAGANSFKFAGRIGGRALSPGRYRLLATSGGVTKSAEFKIVR